MGTSFDIYGVIVGLAGGLAVFLFGMGQLASGLKGVAGDRMRAVLARLTANRFIGALTGAFVTAVIQSSSVTTVLVVGFISAGLMTLTQSVGVIMGANVGTTLTAQVIALRVADEALLIVAIGFALLMLGRRDVVKQVGTAVLGLGLVFLGMALMGETMAPLREYPPFIAAMTHLRNPVVGIVIGAVFTALVQSSSATTGLVIVLAASGFVSLPAGIALALGANIGTCVTAVLASIGRPRVAVRAALVHVLFNVAGVLLWLGFIDQLAALVTAVSPTADAVEGFAKRAAETPRQIANAHTIFNVVNTIVFIGFAGTIARLVTRLVPDKPEAEGGPPVPRYLDPQLLETPALALNAARMEVAEMGARVSGNFALILPALLSGRRAELRDIASMDAAVDVLHQAVLDYLRQLGGQNLTPAEATELVRLMTAANHLEHIGDIIETDMVTLGERLIDEGVGISQPMAEAIDRLHGAVADALGAGVAAAGGSRLPSLKILAMKSNVNALAEAVNRLGSQRLVVQDRGRVRAYARETEIVEHLKRIYYLAKRIARTVVPVEEVKAD
ncbi:MAG: Na/Pi cotransporter family protein [Hyphomicrobiales bacterium]|nr:Na/Pi cotransporter family protein [Hyphomicrobiales bacterium]